MPEPADLEALAERVRGFSAACEGRSPLYAHLSRHVADDPEVLALLSAGPTPGQQHPTLLFAAVQDLLLAGAEAPELARHYPSVGGSPAAGDPWPAFRAFSLAHRDDITERIATRRTQTNEVARSSVLLVALRSIHREVGAPLAWVDVGSSAGLNLHLDRYAHRFRGREPLGDPDSVVQLRCEVEGPAPIDETPVLAWQAGLDAAPVDVADPEARRWLEACVWADQTDRLERLRAALEVAQRDPVTVYRGDAVEDLPGVVARAPASAHLVVTHTWAIAYLDPEARAAFDGALDAIGRTRDLDRVGMEAAGVLPGTAVRDPAAAALLVRSRWRAGQREDRIIGESDDHGTWATWWGWEAPVDSSRTS